MSTPEAPRTVKNDSSARVGCRRLAGLRAVRFLQLKHNSSLGRAQKVEGGNWKGVRFGEERVSFRLARRETKRALPRENGV